MCPLKQKMNAQENKFLSFFELDIKIINNARRINDSDEKYIFLRRHAIMSNTREE